MKECELIKEDHTFGLLTVKLFPKFIGNVVFGHQGFVKNQFVTVGLLKVHLLVKQHNSIKTSYNLIVGMTKKNNITTSPSRVWPYGRL